MKSEFGLFGLGVMGKSLCRNLASKGVRLSMFNREVASVEENVANDFKNKFKELKDAQAFSDIELYVSSLETPRKIMLMVNAGKTVDLVIEDLVPYLSKGDVLIDGGNSNYKDTIRRSEYLKSKNINFIGVGVSGGEEGALKGPSLMPGGTQSTYELIRPFLEVIAAKDARNLPCCAYVGEEGSGHFVKMVHNGIEYVEMQLLAEVISLFSSMGFNYDQIANILEEWKEKVDGYLLEITIDILRKKEGDDWLINKILDKAGNKGTGNWASITSIELGVPSSMMTSALNARYISFFKEERIKANTLYQSTEKPTRLEIHEVLSAYQFARIVNHHQGFKLILEAANTYGWNLNLSVIARIWTNGCIIKSDLMEHLVTVFNGSENILTDKLMISTINSLKPLAAHLVSTAIKNEIPLPCMSEAVNFFHSYKTANSTANILQAQRDYFGAHTYQRKDDPSAAFYHTHWVE